MNKLAAEMWETAVGGEAPADFFKTVEAYVKYKAVFAPAPFTADDFAVCMLFYKLLKAINSKKSKKGAPPEEPKEPPKEETKDE